MNTYTAVLPDGNISTRNSKSRVYTHAVAYKATEKGVEASRWFVLSYSGSRALAEKAMAGFESRFFQARNNGHFAGTVFAIVEVEVAA